MSEPTDTMRAAAVALMRTEPSAVGREIARTVGEFAQLRAGIALGIKMERVEEVERLRLIADDDDTDAVAARALRVYAFALERES